MTILFVTILFLVMLSGCSLDSSREKDLPLHPNFILIITEDIHPMLPCYGDSTVSTPHLSRLAEEGIVFNHAFSTSGVCAPSRSAMITGMYPSSVGSNHMRTRLGNALPGVPLSEYSVVMPPEVRCFPQYLREEGYYCTNRGKRDWQFEKQLTAFDDYGKEGSDYMNRAPGQPFFSIINIFCTHESRVWENPGAPLSCSPINVPVPPYFPDTDTVRNDLSRVYSNITKMDSLVGQIIGRLEKQRLLDSTIVIFISDHGGPLPRQKREILCSGIHIPMIMRLPGAWKSGTHNDQLVSMVDLAPTILSLANVKIPAHMQGHAFMGMQAEVPRKYIYGARDRIDSEPGRARSVCNGKYIYVRNYHPGEPWIQDIEFRKQMPMMQQLYQWHETKRLDSIQSLWFTPNAPAEMLFDLINDPHEVHNLAGDPSYNEILDELRTALDNWLNKTGDMGNIPEKELIETWWPGFKQPVTSEPLFITDENGTMINCTTEGASIAYCVKKDHTLPDPTEPNGWSLYDGPIRLDPDETLYAVANRIGYADSPMVAFQHTDKILKTTEIRIP